MKGHIMTKYFEHRTSKQVVEIQGEAKERTFSKKVKGKMFVFFSAVESPSKWTICEKEEFYNEYKPTTLEGSLCR